MSVRIKTEDGWVKAASVSSSKTEIIFDNEERVIGSFFGKPLYIRSFNNATSVPKGSWTQVCALDDGCVIRHYFGAIFTTNANETLPLQYYRTGTKHVTTAIQSDLRRIEVYLGNDCGNGTMQYITVLYTKNSD